MTMPEHTAYVSLGSNIEPEKNLVKAIRLLRERCTVLALSSVYRTPPQGYTQQADFLNMAVKLTTMLSPIEFKTRVMAEIERQLGRTRDPNNKNAPRTIDLDISLWDDAIIDYGEKPWHIPEGDILRFAHVAIPLAEITPDYVHPETGQTLAVIAAHFDTHDMRREKLGFDAL
jgi:2-amino-4-hydroxy-6-hydroxymethyldihydropteridine diphosphokinase